MQHAETATPCPASPTDPPPVSPGRTAPARTMPAGIAALLHTVRILLGYGRHLAATAKDRATSSDFNAIAACFGTGRLHTIMAHLERGLLRAMALERVLLARAARGRDIEFTAPRKRAAASPAATADALTDPANAHAASADPCAASTDPRATPADPLAAQASAAASPARRATSRPSRPPGWNDPELFMPTLEELEAQVRRRPFGQTLVEICLDLAVVPGFCTGPFWNELFDGIRLHGGSVAVLMQEKMRRHQAFGREQDRKPGSNWDWVEMGREALRRVLGFFIGEAAEPPFEPVAEHYPLLTAAATGPP